MSFLQELDTEGKWQTGMLWAPSALDGGMREDSRVVASVVSAVNQRRVPKGQLVETTPDQEQGSSFPF